MVKRQTAYIVSAAQLLSGEFVKVEAEWEPNYVKVGDRNVSRVNLLGTVISVSGETGFNYEQVTVDDGTGTISVRAFNQPGFLAGFAVGDVVLVIGRPRQYGNEIYILPEIVKHFDSPKWIEVRHLELKLLAATHPTAAAPVAQAEPTIAAVHEESVEEGAEAGPKKDEKQETPSRRVFGLIKMLDDGRGADFDLVVAKSGINGAENIIMTLMEVGEVFEIRPGKLKVLE
jgi:RPA family protein